MCKFAASASLSTSLPFAITRSASSQPPGEAITSIRNGVLKGLHQAWGPAKEIATEMVEAIASDFGGRAKGDVILLINGFGGTPLSELYLMYNDVRTGLETAGCTVARSLVGNFVTSLDMAGCSVTVSLLDDEMKRLWDAPVHTAALRWGV
jgi:dihydroxyacetone kinase